jgi:hypothetical protein
MENINITCDICKATLSVHRTDEIPPEVTELFCNWCPNCEDKADDYYTERYGYTPIPEPINPNQINLDL